MLFNHSEKREKEKWELLGSFLGVKSQSQSSPPSSAKEETFIFQDPEEYKKMSKEERTKLTETMKTSHRSWALSSTKGIGK